MATGEKKAASSASRQNIPGKVWLGNFTIRSRTAYHKWDIGPLKVKPVTATCMDRLQSWFRSGRRIATSFNFSVGTRPPRSIWLLSRCWQAASDNVMMTALVLDFVRSGRATRHDLYRFQASEAITFG
eukprot:CAMPEP_0194284440 /NCGR_PEP_ID=MMETSP0169-20130528/27625_1 /TAXON_ID=218684 /ORGANISM="Corethron pennatum, Strain L29A3" /LENGTH=127 /DNA_ID=CAMNT_0039030259 /DNA_START=549 /DNA_END=929 /DNA_ORIENTATION=-